MLVPGGLRSSSSSSSTNTGSTPLPVPAPVPELSQGQKPPPPDWAATGSARGCRAGSPSAGSGANSGRSGGGSNGGGGGAGSWWWGSQVTSSRSSWKIGMPAWVAGSSSATRTPSTSVASRVGRVRQGGGVVRLHLGFRLRFVARLVGEVGFADRRVRQRRQDDRLLATTRVVDPSEPGLRCRGGGAEEVAQRVAHHGRRHVDVTAAVEHVVAQRVEGARDPGPDLAWPEHMAVLRGRGRHHRAADARPSAGEGGVQQADEVHDVGRRTSRGEAVEGGVDGEADQPDRTVVVDQDVLGHQATVGDAGFVGQGHRVGHLGHDPGGDGRRQRFAVGQQDVEAGAGAPLVDHEAAVGGLVDVEHPQHPAVEDGRRGAGGLTQQRAPARRRRR